MMNTIGTLVLLVIWGYFSYQFYDSREEKKTVEPQKIERAINADAKQDGVKDKKSHIR